MSQIVKVKIRPEGSLKFAAICSNCGQPTDDRMAIARRKGTVTRIIDIPICDTCLADASRRSWAEERLSLVGRLASALVFAGFFVGGYFLLPEALQLWLRLLTAGILAMLVGIGTLGIFKQRSAEMARPEKKAVLSAVQIEDFSWRATTFRFRRKDAAEKFAQLNQDSLMTVESQESSDT